VNSELCRQALIKVGNPNVLVNLVSRRVRQLNSGGGALSRPLLLDATGLGAADVSLRELVEEKMGWEVPQETNAVDTAPSRKKRKTS
jgi:DNA-directed RNA polymerase subunit omega